MPLYADTDFFLALLKPSDWLKEKAEKLALGHSGGITTSDVTFIELMLLAKKFDLDPVGITASVMAICGIEDTSLLAAAKYLEGGGVGVFDAFHASRCGDRIISSGPVYEKLGIERIRLEK